MANHYYKQFHSMNAYIRESTIDDSGYKCIYGGNSQRWRVLDFVSYETHLAEITFDKKYCTCNIKLHLRSPYSYSYSTTRQFNRFLNEYDIPCTRADIERAYSECMPVTPDVAYYRVNDFVTITIKNYY